MPLFPEWNTPATKRPRGASIPHDTRDPNRMNELRISERGQQITPEVGMTVTSRRALTVSRNDTFYPGEFPAYVPFMLLKYCGTGGFVDPELDWWEVLDSEGAVKRVAVRKDDLHSISWK